MSRQEDLSWKVVGSNPSASKIFFLVLKCTLLWNWNNNKCRPILVQGLRRDIEINFHISNIYGSVAQWISAWMWI